VVGEAVRSGAAIETMFVLADDVVGTALAEAAGVVPVVVGERALRRLSTTTSPQSPVAVVATPAAVIPPSGRLLVAWEVGDPGNAGTMVRSAAAFGFGYVAGPGTADTWSPKVVRASAGGHFRTTLGACSTVSDLNPDRSRLVVAAVPRGGSAPGPLPADAAVLIGNEAHGLADDVLAECDELVTIPMAGGFESLNAGVAGAIIAYQASRASV
jgi:RNA methyltransferase, TrmH family